MTQIYTLKLECQWFRDQKSGKEDNEIKLNPDP